MLKDITLIIMDLKCVIHCCERRINCSHHDFWLQDAVVVSVPVLRALLTILVHLRSTGITNLITLECNCFLEEV